MTEHAETCPALSPRWPARCWAAPPLSLTKQGMWLALDVPSFDAMVEVENVSRCWRQRPPTPARLWRRTSRGGLPSITTAEPRRDALIS
jgi:hypothetical protein